MGSSASSSSVSVTPDSPSWITRRGCTGSTCHAGPRQPRLRSASSSVCAAPAAAAAGPAAPAPSPPALSPAAAAAAGAGVGAGEGAMDVVAVVVVVSRPPRPVGDGGMEEDASLGCGPLPGWLAALCVCPWWW